MGLFDFFLKENKGKQEQGVREQQFYLEAKELFADGIIKEIFKRDVFSVCNVANSFYAIFILSDEYEAEHIHFMLLNDDQLELVLKNTVYIFEIYKNRPDNQKMVYLLNERAHSTLRNTYNRMQKGETELVIDAERDARLLEKYKKRNELFSKIN